MHRPILPSLVAIVLLTAGAAANSAESVYLAHTRSGLPVYTNQPVQAGSQPVAMLQTTSMQAPRRFVTSDAGAARAGRQGGDSPLVGRGIDALIRLTARRHGVEEALLRAIIHTESGFNPQARSPAGAVGLMQLMPGTARRYEVADVRDPAQNIEGGVRYLKDLLRMFRGNLRLALAAYNAGEGAVIRYDNRIPPFAETQAYVPTVLARYRSYRAQARASEVQ